MTTQNSVYQCEKTLFGGLFQSKSYSTELACEICRILREKGGGEKLKVPDNC